MGVAGKETVAGKDYWYGSYMEWCVVCKSWVVLAGRTLLDWGLGCRNLSDTCWVQAAVHRTLADAHWVLSDAHWAVEHRYLADVHWVQAVVHRYPADVHWALVG